MLIILVHQPQRELTAKLLLAHKAAHRYGASVLGRTSVISQLEGQIFQRSVGPFRLGEKMKSGVILGFALPPEASIPRRLPKFKKAGFRIASLDEEATAFSDPVSYAKRRIDEKSSELADVVYSWGSWHNEAIKYSRTNPEKIAVVGHPRLEIYQEKFDDCFANQIEFIKKRYGRFVLINTNIMEFDWLSSSFDEQIRKIDKKRREVDRHVPGGFSDFESLKLKAEVRREEFKNQIKIANTLIKKAEDSRLEALTVVMRPKPSVSPHKLELYARENGFLGHVDGRFSVAPWLKSCAAVLHHGCTTAIEATLVGRNAILFGNEDFVAEPVREVSIMARDVPQAVDLLYEACLGNDVDNCLMERYKAVDRWHQNIGRSPSDAILDDLEQRNLLNDVVNKGGCLSAIESVRVFSRFSASRNGQYNSNLRGRDAPITFGEVASTVKCLDYLFRVKTSCKEVVRQTFHLERVV